MRDADARAPKPRIGPFRVAILACFGTELFAYLEHENVGRSDRPGLALELAQCRSFLISYRPHGKALKPRRSPHRRCRHIRPGHPSPRLRSPALAPREVGSLAPQAVLPRGRYHEVACRQRNPSGASSARPCGDPRNNLRDLEAARNHPYYSSVSSPNLRTPPRRVSTTRHLTGIGGPVLEHKGGARAIGAVWSGAMKGAAVMHRYAPGRYDQVYPRRRVSEEGFVSNFGPVRLTIRGKVVLHWA